MFKLVGFTEGVALYAYVAPSASAVASQRASARRTAGNGEQTLPVLPVAIGNAIDEARSRQA